MVCFVFRCNNEVNDYSCNCHPGYTGKNCQEDINECADEEQSCLNGADCFELSNVTLYSADPEDLPEAVRSNFTGPFSYSQAAGFVCNCALGFEGESSIYSFWHLFVNQLGSIFLIPGDGMSLLLLV